MPTKPKTTLWDLAQVDAGKPQDALPFGGSYTNRRAGSLRGDLVRLAATTQDKRLKRALLDVLLEPDG